MIFHYFSTSYNTKITRFVLSQHIYLHLNYMKIIKFDLSTQKNWNDVILSG